MVGNKIESPQESVPVSFGSKNDEYDSFDEHMKKLAQENGTPAAEKDPAKEQYLEELKELEEKLDTLRGEHIDIATEASVYLDNSIKLIKDGAPDKDIREEQDKAKKAILALENNSINLLEADENFGDYLKQDKGFLSPEEKGTKREKYSEYQKEATDFIEFQKREEENDIEIKKFFNRRQNV